MKQTDQQVNLLKLLEDFRKSVPALANETTRVIELVSTIPTCANRANFSPGHLTGSAWIVNGRGDKVILLRHAKLNKWLQPGGHADGDFNLHRVALREAQEETGLRSLHSISSNIFDLDIHTIPAFRNEPSHFHFDVRFAFRAAEEEPFVRSSESKDITWAPLDNLQVLTSNPAIHRMQKHWAKIADNH